jgi:predicted HTH transcriptional regulator
MTCCLVSSCELLSRIQSFFDVYRRSSLCSTPSSPSPKAKLIEQWGSGVRRIFREALELGLPEPQFVELGLRVRLVVRLAHER